MELREEFEPATDFPIWRRDPTRWEVIVESGGENRESRLESTILAFEKIIFHESSMRLVVCMERYPGPRVLSSQPISGSTDTELGFQRSW